MNDFSNLDQPSLPPTPRSSFTRFWKRLDGSQKTGLAVLTLVALTLPLGTAAALIEVRNRSQAYQPPISSPISPPYYPTPSPSPSASPTSSPISCVRRIHTVTMTPSLQAGYPGTTRYYQTVVTNQDSSSCGGSYFTASSLLPHPDWWASFSPAAPYIAPGQSTIITSGFTSSINNSPETVPVATVVRGPNGSAHATSAYQVLAGTGPTPTPTLMPTPTITPAPPTPSPSPSITPLPSIIPTPTTTPKPTATPSPSNAKPYLLTRSLPPGRLNRSYSALLTAFDRDRDPLTFKVAGLPRGLRTFSCGAVKPNFFRVAQCSIAGQPTVRGTFTVYVSVIDNRGGSATQKLQLTIR